MRSLLAEHLRTHTRTCHARLDARLGLPGSVRTRTDLAVLLHALVTAWQPLEEALHGVDGWAEVGLDPRLGDASDLLHRDLDVLGRPDTPAAHVVALRPFGSLPEAVGARYVLLGSAMGGRAIAPVVEHELGLVRGEATGFFRRSGMDPGADWARFQRATADLDTPAALAGALSGAQLAFDVIGAAAAAQVPWPLPGRPDGLGRPAGPAGEGRVRVVSRPPS
ncbi:biliverdin-producing heme oxygenase [Pseudonocardia abyssalis]|uniref:Biliverdin-producing heme oxygenase n=1 Tax=Pseudonocardia abyssalis TaxID=2792008 RepID=A0ABS6UYB0_9PSEU|nr:biliverdin-producing heme oxygenase [Pseudonocardia abyssalis]MBW0116734.1 biliverdin-producing heme oxygenase [Pseudonocardia abyssalis]MBW0137242.1 biliverdin-producing heme oxygenase [Pseudonocardia abyssalis]